MIRRPRSSPLFPYPPLFRSADGDYPPPVPRQRSCVVFHGSLLALLTRENAPPQAPFHAVQKRFEGTDRGVRRWPHLPYERREDRSSCRRRYAASRKRLERIVHSSVAEGERPCSAMLGP